MSEGHGEINISRLEHSQYKIYFLKRQGERLVRIGAGEAFNFYTMNDESEDASACSETSFDSDRNSSCNTSDHHFTPVEYASHSSSLPISITSDRIRAAAQAHVR